MSGHPFCSRDFPDGCAECPEYEENYPAVDAALDWFGFYSGPAYIVKRCRRFNWTRYERK